MSNSNDIVTRCMELYEKYWSFRDEASKDKFRDHLRTTDVPREIIMHKLTQAEEYALKKLRKYPPAWRHKASSVFYNQNRALFEGKRILEIGSGRHIDRLLVELSQTYHGVDAGYKMIPMQRAMEYLNAPDPVLQFIGSLFMWPIRTIRERMEKGLDDNYAYDFRSLRDSLDYRGEEKSSTGFLEYADQSGKILLVACDYRDLSTQYDVVINGGARLERDDLPKVKGLLARGGTFMMMAPPDMPVLVDDLTTKLFSNQREVWIELKGRKEGSVYTAFIATDG